MIWKKVGIALLSALLALLPVLPIRGQTAPPPPGPLSPGPVSNAPPAAAATPPAPTTSPAWLPRRVAELQIVDKVNATHRILAVPVGGSARVGALAIKVKACLVRPPGHQRNAAAYLDIVGKNPAAPAFQGWMVAAEPAASVLEDPIYDVRVSGCR